MKTILIVLLIIILLAIGYFSYDIFRVKNVECGECFYAPTKRTPSCKDPSRKYSSCGGSGRNETGCEARFSSKGDVKWKGCFATGYFEEYSLPKDFVGCRAILRLDSGETETLCRCNHADRCNDAINNSRWECREEDNCHSSKLTKAKSKVKKVAGKVTGFFKS